MKWLSGIFRWFTNGFLKIFGDIKIFPFPLFLLYSPKGYRVKGEDVRQVIHEVQPGDILIRGYINYLDGYFIPGYFSHAGLYLGEVTEDDRMHLRSEKGHDYFRTGKQMVAHAMAEGVFMEDVLNFCRCDHMIILRPHAELKAHPDNPKVNYKYLNQGETDIAKRLLDGKTLTYETVFPLVFQAALEKLGEPYDFQFNFSNFNNLSCTEYVHYCLKCLEPYHGMKPRKKNYILFSKSVLLPDQFLNPYFEIIWQSRSVDSKKLGKSLQKIVKKEGAKETNAIPQQFKL